MSDISALNPAQQSAVIAPPGHVLVLAGAGSGKTRVLTERIAWLIDTQQATAHEILSVTFTNKAAGEMRSRIEKLIGPGARKMWVGTFHGLAHRLLRTHWQEAGLPEQFQIMDSADQQRLIRRLIAQMGLDEKRWPAKDIQHFINAQKDEGVRAGAMSGALSQVDRVRHDVYVQYERACMANGMLDFAELLLRAYELWRDNSAVLSQYQNRFKHVLVDEFQDTNTIQYAWVQKIIGPNNHLMVVGDDDQSIYGWRGARVENILRFSRDFPNVETIRLEQNYRSTGNILSAANAVISCNSNRLGKALWTQDGSGEPITLYTAFNEVDEARFVSGMVQEGLQQGMARHEMAVLYRSNAQSRVIEEALIQAGIPYRVYGGLRFFERAEIKDALSYLRLVLNRNDDGALERAIVTPTRGVGTQTLERIREHGRVQECSLWQSIVELLAARAFPPRASNALFQFVELIDSIAQAVEGQPLAEQIAYCNAHSGLADHYQKEGPEKAQTRLENLSELVNAGRQFTPPWESEASPLAIFLAHASLESGEQEADASESVSLMTLHAAKGLEFAWVFLVGVEEGLFPHQMSLDDPSRLAEERRLCYVGMTRARRRLFISHAESRRLYGRDHYPTCSRFVREIPSALMQPVRTTARPPSSGSGYGGGWGGGSYRGSRSTPSYGSVPTPVRQPMLTDTSVGGFHLGQTVQHPVFGEGTLVGIEGSGDQARVQVKFWDGQSKWLVLAYARLTAG